MTLADFAKPLTGPIIPAKDLLTAEEVADPGKLPFTGEHHLRLEFLSLVQAKLHDEVTAFLSKEHVPDLAYGTFLYLPIRLVRNRALSKKDFSQQACVDALVAVATPVDLVDRAVSDVMTAHSHVGKPTAHAHVTIARFKAIAEEGYEHKLLPRPYWVLPPNNEVSGSTLMSAPFHCSSLSNPAGCDCTQVAATAGAAAATGTASTSLTTTSVTTTAAPKITEEQTRSDTTGSASDTNAQVKVGE